MLVAGAKGIVGHAAAGIPARTASAERFAPQGLLDSQTSATCFCSMQETLRSLLPRGHVEVMVTRSGCRPRPCWQTWRSPPWILKLGSQEVFDLRPFSVSLPYSVLSSQEPSVLCAAVDACEASWAAGALMSLHVLPWQKQTPAATVEALIAAPLCCCKCVFAANGCQGA